MQLGFDVAKDHILTGVGLGAFSDFSLSYNNAYDYAKGIVWNEPRGFPATNVFVELLAEGGIWVLICFVFFLLYILKNPRTCNIKSRDNFFEWRQVLIILLLLLCIESSLLRPYFWFYLGILSGLSSIVKKGKVIDE